MALTGDTGNGATLTLALYSGTTAITASLALMTITPGELSVPSIDVSTLATSGVTEMIPGDLATPGESSATFKFLSGSAFPTLPSPTGSSVLTFPLASGQTAAATYSGTAFITKLQLPSLQNNQLQTGTISWQYDGDTGPTFTPAS